MTFYEMIFETFISEVKGWMIFLSLWFWGLAPKASCVLFKYSSTELQSLALGLFTYLFLRQSLTI